MRCVAEQLAWRRWTGVTALAALLAGHQALGQWRDNHALMINSSASLPNWAFFVTRGRQPGRGDYVFFAPPPSAVLHEHFGDRPQPFGKQVLGMPGETVRHHGRAVTVGVNVVSWTKPRSRRGMLLEPGPHGVIPPQCYYVGTDHPDGFDSRYAGVGFVCTHQILGVGRPIL